MVNDTHFVQFYLVKCCTLTDPKWPLSFSMKGGQPSHARGGIDTDLQTVDKSQLFVLIEEELIISVLHASSLFNTRGFYTW